MIYDKSNYPFESRHLQIDGEKIHYIDEGKGQVILFSHAALGSSFMYRHFIKSLAKSHRCVALDYPGFGASPGIRQRKYGIFSQSSILWKFIDALGLNEIIGFGHDTGGPSLAKVVADHPNLFSGLVLCDTLLFPVREYPRVNRMLRIVGSPFFQALNAYTNLLVRLTFSVGVRTRQLSVHEKATYARMFDRPYKRRRITQMLKSLRDERQTIARIQRIFTAVSHQLPVLLFYGEKDPIAEMGVAERMQQSFANCTLKMIENEGHFPHEGKATEMISTMTKWMVRHYEYDGLGFSKAM